MPVPQGGGFVSDAVAPSFALTNSPLGKRRLEPTPMNDNGKRVLRERRSTPSAEMQVRHAAGRSELEREAAALSDDMSARVGALPLGPRLCTQ